MAPGPALRSREIRLAARARPDAGRLDELEPEPSRSRRACSRRRDWTRGRGDAPGRPGRPTSVAVAAPAARVHAARRRRSGPAPRDLARAPPVTINGRPVTDDLLAPGWTPYGHRLLADTYDVTALLQPGRERDRRRCSAMAGTAGRLGWNPDGDRCTYGGEIGLIAQLEIELADGSPHDRRRPTRPGGRRPGDPSRPTCTTARYRPAPSGRIGWDEPGFDDACWAAGCRRADRPTRRSSRGLRRRSGPWPSLPAGADRPRRWHGSLLDGGQNIAGFVRLRVRGRAERRCGSGTPRSSSRTARCTSGRCGAPRPPTTYVLADDRADRPRAALHVPRLPLRGGRDRRRAPRCGVRRDQQRHAARGTFECSDPALNRFHENVVWSQRDNFVSVPTDCPQRDERLGWTGDAQAFAATGSTLVRRAGVLAKLAAGPRARAGPEARRPERRPERRSRRADASSAGPAGRTPPRSCPGRCTRRTAIRASSRTNGPACEPGSIPLPPGAAPTVS